MEEEKPILVSGRTYIGHEAKQYWSLYATTTGRSPPFVEHKESPPQAHSCELMGGLAIRLGELLLQRQDARHDTS